MVGLFAHGAEAATPAPLVYISFESKNYAPLGYLQRARLLPVAGSDVVLSADIFSQTSDGALTRIEGRQYFFRWYFNGIKIEEGLGEKELRYRVPKYSPANPLPFRVEIFGSLAGNAPLAAAELNIPIAEPKVMVYPVRNGRASAISQKFFFGAPGSSIDVFARPFFFNTMRLDTLILKWSANDQLIGTGSAETLSISIKLPDQPVSQKFSVSAENSDNPVERAAVDFTVYGQ